MHINPVLLSTSVFIALLSTTVNSYSQTQSVFSFEQECGTDNIIEERIANDEDFKRKREAFEITYQNDVKNIRENSVQKSQGDIYTIPTVVHVIHSGLPLGSKYYALDDETIRMRIQEASDRFRQQHQDAETYANPFNGADTEIELCLIDTDPDGNYTTGIIRYHNLEQNFDPTLSYIESLEYDPDKYMNIFIADRLTFANAYFLGSSTVYYGSTFVPTIICHEIGHYLSLDHTFLNGCTNNNCLVNGDKVCDTPPKVTPGLFSGYIGDCDSPDNECATDEDDDSLNNPYRSVTLGGMGDQPDMLTNYMDYGACRNSFTEGQKIRMRSDINTNRISLVNNYSACNNSVFPQDDAGIIDAIFIQTDACDHTITADVTLKNFGESPLSSVEIVALLENGSRFVHSWNGQVSSGSTDFTTIDFPILDGIQLVKLFTQNPNNTGIDGFENNDTLFVNNVVYSGGSTCEPISSCETFDDNTTLGPGNTTMVNVAGAFPDFTSENGKSILICITVQGQVSNYNANFNIYDESNKLRGITNYVLSDCSEQPSAPSCFEVSIDEYDIWRSDNIISVLLDPRGYYIRNVCLINQVCVDIYVPEGTSSLFGCDDVDAHNYDDQATYDFCETCTDGVLNGDETEIDCGGSLCRGCILTSKPICGANNGTAIITDPNNYISSVQWDAAANDQTTLKAIGLSEGTYFVTITENDGSVYTTNTTISARIEVETQIDKLTLNTESGADNFGNSIDSSADWVVLAEENDDDFGIRSGAVHIYKTINGNLIEYQKLKASDAESEANFGNQVKIYEDIIIIGARSLNANNKAYIFRFDGDLWIEDQIINLDPSIPNNIPSWMSFDLFENLLVIGSHRENQNIGSTRIYSYDGNQYQLIQSIIPPDPNNSGQFGFDVSINQNSVVAIGSTGDLINGVRCGTVYIYQPNGATWSLSEKIEASTCLNFAQFGSQVELDGNRLVVSSIGDDIQGINFAGAVYVFEYDGNVFVEKQKLVASIGSPFARFGTEISIYENKMLIGTSGNNQSFDQGSAYLFDLNESGWDETYIIVPEDSEHNDEYSSSLTLYNSDFALIGAPKDDDAGPNSGSVYIYQFPNNSGDSDLDGVCDDIDNCITTYNPDQLDANEDGFGDVCCFDQQVINNTYQSGDTDHVEVTDYIQADNLIEAGANIIYDAATSIELSNGFEVEQSAVFHAYIDGCGND